MDNSFPKLHASYLITEKSLFSQSPETKQLVRLGRRNHWACQVLGKAPMVKEPVVLGDWLLVPAQDDSTKIPKRTLDRIQAIFAAGLRPQGFVLVHEAPKLLKAPAKPKVQPKTPPMTTASPQSTSDIAAAFGTGLLTLASVFIPMLYLFFAAAMVDPILVAVTEDGYWIEIDRWFTE